MKRMLLVIYPVYRYLIFFPLFGLITLICGITAVLLSGLGNHKYASRYSGGAWARLSGYLTPMRVEVCGREHADRKQSYVIVVNHPSAYDIFLIYGWLGLDFKWIIKKEVRKIPIIGYSSEKVGHIFIDRSNTEAAIKSLQIAKEKIKNGISVVFFPEGTRSPEHGLRRFKKGAFRMALDLGLPILPVTIIGTEKILPNKTTKLMPGKAKLIIHPPIPTQNINPKEMMHLVDQTRDVIAAPLHLAKSDEQCKTALVAG